MDDVMVPGFGQWRRTALAVKEWEGRARNRPGIYCSINIHQLHEQLATCICSLQNGRKKSMACTLAKLL